MFETINNNLKVACKKIIGNNMQCSVEVNIIYRKKMIDKIDLKKAVIEDSNFEAEVAKRMGGYAFKVSDADIKRISALVKETLSNGKAALCNEVVPFNDVLITLENEAKKKAVMLSSLFCIENGYLYIAASKANIAETLDVCNCSGWRPLEFKRELKRWKLLETDKDRYYEKTVYSLGRTSVKGEQGVRFLKINLQKIHTLLKKMG